MRGAVYFNGNLDVIHGAKVVLRDTIRLNQLQLLAADTSPVIAIDFDAVIHDYNGDPKKMGPPIPGALAGIKALIAHGAKLVIFSVRSTDQIISWLKKYNFPKLEVTNKKPIAKVYLDDRGITFKGRWTNKLVNQLLSFSPYWEKPGIDANDGNWFETYGGIHVIPTYHPPSLKNPKKEDDPLATTGWKKGDSKKKKKVAREDMRIIEERNRRDSTGQPQISHRAVYPSFPSMYTWI